MYDYIIITHIPAFYKVNLYNELAKKLNILVVFIASDTDEKRADDFITLDNAKFKYELLCNGNFQTRDLSSNIKKLKQVLKNNEYRKVLVSGWDLKEFWYIVFRNSKLKNCLALESSINDSRTDGIRGWIKKIFLSRISTVFASGNLHKELLNVLNYKGKIKITKGVGIINKPEYTSKKKEYYRRFLFIGRLSHEKNIHKLIDIFNELPEYTLTIIGAGPLENELKTKSKSNIIFLGQIENFKLKDYFLTNDIFILPSIAESWGLVVEEALYFGLPVLVSERCGASELVKNSINGYIINEDVEMTKNIIININAHEYIKLLDGVSTFSISKKDKVQIEAYL